MKRKWIIIGAIVALVVAGVLVSPVIPIGKHLSYVDLSNGNLISRQKYLSGLFSSDITTQTELTPYWPQDQHKSGRILITESIIYPFSEGYICLYAGREYYKLKMAFMNNQLENRPQETIKPKIIEFIKYCKKNNLVK